MRVALRHAAARRDNGDADAVFESGDLRVDLLKRETVVRGVAVHLTPNEFRLLSVLVRHAGMVLTHRQLLKEAWGPAAGRKTTPCGST